MWLALGRPSCNRFAGKQNIIEESDAGIFFEADLLAGNGLQQYRKLPRYDTPVVSPPALCDVVSEHRKVAQSLNCVREWIATRLQTFRVDAYEDEGSGSNDHLSPVMAGSRVEALEQRDASYSLTP